MSEKKRSSAGKGLAVFGVIILLLGAALFIYGMSVIDWDFKQLSTFRYEYRTYEAENDEIDSIFVDFDQTNVRVEISETAQKITISYPSPSTEQISKKPTLPFLRKAANSPCGKRAVTTGRITRST